MSNLPEGLYWRGFGGNVKGWFLLDKTRYVRPSKKTRGGPHYVLGIFEEAEHIRIILYKNGSAEDRMYFGREPLTKELRDRLAPIGLINRRDI